MDIQHLKQISITDYLRHKGYTPSQIKGINYWYCSPLRQERTPSFKVNSERNQWYDFGTDEHGDIIDLVRALHRCSTAEAIKILKNTTSMVCEDFSFGGCGGRKKSPERKLEISSVQPLSNPHLLSYISERKIPISVARQFCSEIHYSNAGRSYYAIGFRNDAGGWELRSPYFKGCIAPKTITTTSNNRDRLLIFEGFMDFLSWQTVNLTPTYDAIILNSLALLPRIKERIKGYSQVESFLDNDETGRKSFERLRQTFPQVIDGAARYREHKDLNEWLVYHSKIKEKEPLLPSTKRGVKR